MSKEKTKMEKCIHHLPDLKLNGMGLDFTHYCRFNAGDDMNETTDEKCESCTDYSSKYIEYPLQVQGIDVKFGDPIEAGMFSEKGCLVKIRPVAEKYNKKTYVGFLIGDICTGIHASFDTNTERLGIRPDRNPAIFVPDLNEVIFGYASWWSPIKSLEEVQEITDHDIANVWYVKLLRELSEKKEGDSDAEI